jgi:hypothetical protein
LAVGDSGAAVAPNPRIFRDVVRKTPGCSYVAGSGARALAQGLLADCSTRIVYRQEADQLAASAASLGFSGTERELLPTLGISQGLWRIRDRAFAVQHQMTLGEFDLFDTTTRMSAD